MRVEQYDRFIDPDTGSPLRLGEHTLRDGHVESGWLVDASSARRFEIRAGIPRFVPASNYAANFGLQWQTHSSTQLDSHTGATYSRDRVRETTGWPDDLTGQLVLEAGSGAGRFTEVLAGTGATLYSFDYSEAVAANLASNGKFPNLHLFQGDIYRIPLAKGSFDKVFCLGVIQHTPDVERTFKSLAAMVRPGGQLVVDVYVKKLVTVLHWKYVVRPVTKRMNPARLYRFVNWYAPKLMPLAKVMRRLLGRAGHRLVPILDQSDKKVPPQVQRDWTILDTFDALSPRYDQPQTQTTLRRWFEECGFTDIQFLPGPIGGGGLVGRGTAPAQPRR